MGYFCAIIKFPVSSQGEASVPDVHLDHTDTFDEILPAVEGVSRERGREILEQAAQRHLGITGDAFIQRWESGGFSTESDTANVMRVAKLLPLGRG